MGQLLERINEPHALKSCTLDELSQLARELRRYIIDTVSQTGGHLAPSLGTVELTLALHRSFDCPEDKIVWDVGHQAYAHKILTGRREAFAGLRQKGGITGFPKREESVYDAFGTGHSSTSISAALGMAAARDIAGEHYRIAAVIGDGALTGGEAFEGLNNAGTLGKDIIVILNDNGMSIAPNVGAMSEYLSRFRVAPGYHRAKQDIKNFLKSIPHIGERVYRTAEHIKDGVRSALVPGGLFTDMGFHYIGPLDGHNIALLLDVFEQAKQLKGPLLIHVETCKGKGYAPAEKAPDKFHGIGRFDVADGTTLKKAGAKPTYTSVFGKALLEAAEEDADVVAITAAMPDGTGLRTFGEKYPTRFFDVGIAEGHATTFSAGMAKEGMIPFCNIYSSFAQRAYDNIIHDTALLDLPVVFCLDRAGLVGEDGPTHHGVFDIAALRPIPHLIIASPYDECQLRHLMFTAQQQAKHPFVIRYPRGGGRRSDWRCPMEAIEIGRGRLLQQGTGEVALLSFGPIGVTATDAIAAVEQQHPGVKITHGDLRFVKPLDEDLILQVARTHHTLVTLEDGARQGGIGSAVLELLADQGIATRVVRLGLPDHFVEHGSVPELHHLCGIDQAKIEQVISEHLQ